MGGLGATEGPPLQFAWSPPSNIPKYLFWLVALFLLITPANRRPSAWLIVIPLLLVPLAEVLIQANSTSATMDELGPIWQPVRSLFVGLAVVWLLLPKLTGTNRFLAFLKAWLALTISACFLAAISGGLNQAAPELAVTLVLIAVLPPGLIAALTLAGRFSRRHYSEPLLLFWLLLWLAAAVFLTVMPFVCIAAVVESSVVLGPAMTFVAVAIGVTFGLLLPWVLLSWISPFYRARLREWLRVETPSTPAAPPPIPVSPPVPDLNVSSV